MDAAADRAFSERFPAPKLPTDPQPQAEPTLPTLGVLAASLRLPTFSGEKVASIRDLLFGSAEEEDPNASLARRRRRKTPPAGVKAPPAEPRAPTSAGALEPRRSEDDQQENEDSVETAETVETGGSADTMDAGGKDDMESPQPGRVWSHQLFGFEARSMRRRPSSGSGFSKSALEALGQSVDDAEAAEKEDGEAVERILTRELMFYVSRCLPALVRMDNWKLLYSMRSHGASFSTLARRVKGYECTLLLVHTVKNEVFGGFATRPWELTVDEKDAQYYGSGQSFLFRVNEAPEDIEGEVQFFERVSIYPWSRRNSYFQLSSNQSLAFGAGGASFGLYIGRNALGYDLAGGTSGTCDTYVNEPLAPISGQDFDIVEIEMWTPTKATTERRPL